MKLVTFQTIEAVNDLFKKGYLECNKNKINIEKAGPTYKWVINKMNERIPNTNNVDYPLWCWVKCYNGIYPPKKKGKRVEGFDVKITFNKKKEDIFITDYRRYSFLLKNMYIPDSIEDKEKFDNKLKESNISLEDLKAYVRKINILVIEQIKNFLRCVMKIKKVFIDA